MNRKAVRGLDPTCGGHAWASLPLNQGGESGEKTSLVAAGFPRAPTAHLSPGWEDALAPLTLSRWALDVGWSRPSRLSPGTQRLLCPRVGLGGLAAATASTYSAVPQKKPGCLKAAAPSPSHLMPQYSESPVGPCLPCDVSLNSVGAAKSWGCDQLWGTKGTCSQGCVWAEQENRSRCLMEQTQELSGDNSDLCLQTR